MGKKWHWLIIFIACLVYIINMYSNMKYCENNCSRLRVIHQDKNRKLKNEKYWQRTSLNVKIKGSFFYVGWSKITWTFLIIFDLTFRMLSNFYTCNICPHVICTGLPSFVLISQSITKLKLTKNILLRYHGTIRWRSGCRSENADLNYKVYIFELLMFLFFLLIIRWKIYVNE